MKKNLTIVFLSILFSMYFSMHCMDVEIRKESLEADQDLYSHLKQTMELYNQGLDAWKQAEKLQEEIKALSLEITTNKKIKVEEYQKIIYDKYYTCVASFCIALEYLLNAYDRGYKKGYDEAWDAKFRMNVFENEYIIKSYEKLDPEVRKIQIKRLTSASQSTVSSGTRNSVSAALEHSYKILELKEEFTNFRQVLLVNFLKEVEAVCEAFWCADFLDHPDARRNLLSILTLLDPSYWVLSERSRQLLEQVKTNMERSSSIENSRSSTRSTSQLSLLQAVREDSKRTLSSESSGTDTSRNPITKAVLMYNQGTKTLDQIAERKREKKFDEALGLYGAAIEYFLNAHTQGLEQGWEAALKTYENLKSYEKSCKRNHPDKKTLESAIRSHDQMRQQLYMSVKKIKEHRGIDDFPSAYHDQLFHAMLDRYNQGVIQSYLCESLLAAFKREMAQNIIKVTDSAHLLAEAAARTLIGRSRYIVDDKDVKDNKNTDISFESFIYACKQLLKPSNWELSESEKNCIEKTKLEIQKKVLMNSYASLLEPTFKEASKVFEPQITWSQCLRETKRTESSLTAAAAAAAPVLASVAAPDSRAPLSSTEQPGRRTSGPTKRLSVVLRELTGLDSTNTDG